MKITNITLPTTLSKPYHLLLLADLHSRIPQGFFRTVSALGPDRILISGDLVDGSFATEPHLYALLHALASLAPTYYATGNHELFHDPDRILVKESGALLLENEAITDGELTIGGLASGFGHIPYFGKTPAPDLDFIERFSQKDGYKILLAHHPEYFDEYLRGKAIDLTVSGHAHGGQWRLGKLAAYAPGQGIFPRYTSGLYQKQGQALVVSRGLGNHTWVPRIFNPTELVMIHLMPT